MKLVPLVAFVLVALSASARAEDPVVRVGAARVKNCNTDGGPVKCSLGAQTLARGLQLRLDDLALPCPGAAKRKATITLKYEYNEGTVFYYSHVAAKREEGDSGFSTAPVDEASLTDPSGKALKKLPGLPRCVNETFIPKAAGLVLDYLKKLMEIDPETDVRADYELKLDIE